MCVFVCLRVYVCSGLISLHRTITAASAASSAPEGEGGIVEVRGSTERDILSLRAFGLGGRQLLRVARVAARALFDVLGEQ